MDYKIRILTSNPAPDDQRLNIIRRDASGGVNTRQEPTRLTENQFTALTNVDISTPGERTKRLGNLATADDVGNVGCKELFTYVRQGYSDFMALIEGTTLWTWTTGDTTWTSRKTNFTDTIQASIIACKESGLTPDDVFVVQNGTDNAWRVHIDGSGNYAGDDLGDGNTSPPVTRVGCWYGNRLWYIKNDLLYYSDAYDEDYGGAFDRTTNIFRVQVGEEMALVPTRDMGIICFGKSAVWAIAPSTVPAVTDQPILITSSVGCIAEKSACVVGDDVYWLAQDGVRAVKRTVQDKVQLGAEFPVSYLIKDEIDDINWAYAYKACAVYFDNKYLIAVPTGASTYNNKVLVFYPALNAWTVITGWNVGSWSKYEVAGEERLYYGDSNNGQMYRAFVNYTDNGTAISYSEESRKEDFGQPLLEKNGGELEIETNMAGDYDLTISTSIDGAAYEVLGTINLINTSAPVLPVALPFTLAGEKVLKQKFHLDGLGSFRTIQIKIENAEANTDEIKIYGINIVTFAEEYFNE
jgi:hypothetical protein